jgi:nicotinate-nucleotide adenylyltransferase
MAHLLLYGGTFDPIHYGHLIPCRAACELLRADRVLFIPAQVSPHKQAGAPAATSAQRLHMLELALAGHSDFAVDARELSRLSPPPSYTFDTVAELQRDRPGDRFTLLVGQDQLPMLHTWHRIADLLALVPVAVLARQSDPAGLTIARRHLGALADRLTLLPTPRIDISATDIRRRIAAGLPICFLVPAAVAALIAAENLYRLSSTNAYESR